MALSPIEIRWSRESIGLSSRWPVLSYDFRDPPRHSKVHVHDFHSVFLIHTGTADLETTALSTPLAANSVVIGHPGVVRQFRNQVHYSGVGVFYLTEWLMGESFLGEDRLMASLALGETWFPSLAPRHPTLAFSVPPATREFLQRGLNEINEEYASAHPSLFAVKLIFLRFLHTLARAYAAEHREEELDHFNETVWKAVQHIEWRVRQHEGLDLAELARKAGCSASHLRRIFHRATGISPTGYFQRRRMQHAGLQLMNSDTSITEIAYRVGCSDSAHFSRLFFREMKMTPSAYRKFYEVRPRATAAEPEAKTFSLVQPPLPERSGGRQSQS